MSSKIDLPEILCNFCFCNVGTGEIKTITVGWDSYSVFTLAVDILDWLYLAQFLDDNIYQCDLDRWEFPSNLLLLSCLPYILQSNGPTWSPID